jgi:type VI secretion system protein ImpA
MPTESVIDIELLLQPIAGDNPAGIDPRGESTGGDMTASYRSLRDAVNEARRLEKLALNGEPAGEPDWSGCMSAAINVLAGESKDLPVAAMLVDCLARVYGFAGLRDGLRFLAGLVDQYFENAWPLPEGEDQDTRFRSIANLNGEGGNGTLLRPIRSLPLTDPAGPGYSLSSYQQVQLLAQSTDETQKQSRIDSGYVTDDQFRSAAARSAAGFYETLSGELEACRVAMAEVNDVFSRRLGYSAPPTGDVSAAIDECIEVVKTYGPVTADAATDVSTEGASEPVPGGAARSTGGVRNREQILNEIWRLTEELDRLEPQSLIVPKLQMCVKLARMNRTELLNMLIRDSGTLENVFRFIGMEEQSPSN